MDHWLKMETEAAEKVAAMLKLPVDTDNMMSCDERFDPWELFGVYGSYSSDFDECAIDVLEELKTGEKVRDDLGAEMFREMLCKMDLCSYGTSPRVCFPNSAFKELLPDFLEKWKAYSEAHWGREEG